MTDAEEIRGVPVAKNQQYKSILAREVPWCGFGPYDERFNDDLCWWCQDQERIKAVPDVLVWCPRCYKLNYKKHDGTYMEQSTIGIGKDLMDIQKGIVKPKYATIDKDNGRIVIED